MEIVTTHYDAIVVGGGHNGLTAAAYLARAGRSVLLLERAPATGGATVSAEAFPGIAARLSRYAYLVSLLPDLIVRELGLDVALRRRQVAAYAPCSGGGAGGLLVGDDAQAALLRFTGDPAVGAAWARLTEAKAALARAVFPSLTEPLVSRAELRRRVGDDAAWAALVDEPLGAAVAPLRNDVVQGMVLTDALIGTFASAEDASLQQNRCFLYHVVGRGTGDWDVPVGGMGEITRSLAERALALGARIQTDAEVTAIRTDGREAEVVAMVGGEQRRFTCTDVLAAVAPAVLGTLLGEPVAPSRPAEAGAQLKINLLLRRLPRLRDHSVRPEVAFAGTFHVNETRSQLETAYAEAAAGRLPSLPPCEVYCHSLTDPSILGPQLRASGVHTMTLFALHQPHALFVDAPDAAKARAVAATLRSLDSVLAEPIEDCLLTDAEGRPCIEAATTVDLERSLAMPGGNIFHRPLQWPFAESDDDIGRWGVETAHANVLLCGAGARRGGGVSGIPGRNAVMKLLSGG